MTFHIKKILITFFLFYSFGLFAQEHSNFWEIKSPDGSLNYLYGTIHTDDNRVSNISKKVIEAMKACQLFLMETDDISDPNLLTNNNLTYESYLDESEIEKIRYLADFHTMQYEKVIKMKPWLLAVIFDSPRPITPFNLDNLLKTKAIDLGLEIKGIETSEEHFQVLDDFSITEQISFLRKVLSLTMKQKELDYEELISAYLSQNSDYILKVNERLTKKLVTKDMWIKMKKKLLNERNNLFFNRSIELMSKQQSFIAVGASHLGGIDGLLSQFKKSGYQIKALPN